MPKPSNDVVHWLSFQSATSGFARSLLRYLGKHGGELSDAQLARAVHMMEREQRRIRRLLRPSKEDIVAMTRRWPPEK